MRRDALAPAPAGRRRVLARTVRCSLPALAVLALAGCSGEDAATSTTVPEAAGTSVQEQPRTDADNPDGGSAQRPRRPTLQRARCPADAAPGCRSASGRVVYVERVDPDGDGDAHFVLASDDSITAPGISVIDVRRDLRPRPLPRPGDRISAAGPVYRGSYGQRQIEAVVVHVSR